MMCWVLDGDLIMIGSLITITHMVLCEMGKAILQLPMVVWKQTTHILAS